jgi:hypothetical protein
MSLEPFTSRPPTSSDPAVTPVTPPQSAETALPRLSGSPEGTEGRGEALTRFIHRPLPVRAILWDGTPEALWKIQAWVASEGGEAYQSGDRLVIRHRSGSTPVRPGDWVVRSGVWLTCPGDTFQDHCTPDPLAAWPRWGSAADTVAEHASEAEARTYAQNCVTVHRWPDGPWLTDSGSIWAGDEALSRVEGHLWAMSESQNRAARQVSVAERALRLMIEFSRDPAAVLNAEGALAEMQRIADEPARLREALDALTPGETTAGEFLG